MVGLPPRKPTPTDVTHEHTFFCFRGWTRLRFEFFEQINDGEVVSAFLLGRADAEFVGVRDAVVALIARRL